MVAPILPTKLYLPALRPQRVPRARLVERLNEGLAAGSKLTLISASAGFGKTTLLSEWISAPPLPLGEGPGVRACWLSLDEADSNPARFLLYLVSALQTVAPNLGEGALAALQTPQPPPIETLLTGMLNEIAELPEKVILVLDDYHLLDSQPVDSALAFLFDHLPPHLVIASREDPNLPLTRLHAGGLAFPGHRRITAQRARLGQSHRNNSDPRVERSAALRPFIPPAACPALAGRLGTVGHGRGHDRQLPVHVPPD